MIIDNMEENSCVKKIREAVDLFSHKIEKREIVQNGETGMYFVSIQSDAFDAEITIWPNGTCELILASCDSNEKLFHIDGRMIDSEDCQIKIKVILDSFLKE